MSALSAMLRVETTLFLREPSNVIFGLFLPTGLILGLGAVPALREPSPDLGGLRPVDVWAPTALVFGIVLIAVQHIPTVIATYRERGILLRLSTTPVHPRNVLLALMFFGGAFLPRFMMPDVLVRVGDVVPPGLQALTTAWSAEAGAVTSGGPHFWLQVAIMAGIAVVTGAVAAKLFRWE